VDEEDQPIVGHLGNPLVCRCGPAFLPEAQQFYGARAVSQGLSSGCPLFVEDGSFTVEVIEAGRDLAGKEPGGLVDLALVVGVDPTKAPRRR